jgi:hypothetical protein
MLRIHRTANGDVVFTLSGQVDKEHIGELEALFGAEGKGRHINLDLKDMTWTGRDGIDFLTRCEAAGITLANCDPYVREWITRRRGSWRALMIQNRNAAQNLPPRKD